MFSYDGELARKLGCGLSLIPCPVGIGETLSVVIIISVNGRRFRATAILWDKHALTPSAIDSLRNSRLQANELGSTCARAMIHPARVLV